MTPQTGTTLTLHLSNKFIEEMARVAPGLTNNTSNGVYVYAVNFLSPSFDPQHPETAWTTIISDGSPVSAVLPIMDSNGTILEYTITLDLTNQQHPTLNAGKIYFVIQSGDPTHPMNLPGLITDEAKINPGSASDYQFGYDSFEISLLNKTGDAANLTAVNGYSAHLAVSITLADGSTISRGQMGSFEDILEQIKNINSNIDSFAVSAFLPNDGGLTGLPRTAVSPAGDSATQTYFKANDWTSYATAFIGLSDIHISGQFNGAKGADGIWHNRAYYSYTAKVDPKDKDIIWLTPDTESQVKGFIKLSTDALNSVKLLSSEIYSPGLHVVGIYDDINAKDPLLSTGTGDNNQWGQLFAKLDIGFTAGYWGSKAIPIINNSPLLTPSPPLNLNYTSNWDPSFAFNARIEGLPPTDQQHYDPYAKIFFDKTNNYGTAYADALTSHYTVGPLIETYDPTTSKNVSNVDLYFYGSAESDQYYTPSQIKNFLAPSGDDYSLVTTGPSVVDHNLTITLAKEGLILSSKATIALEIYQGGGEWHEIMLDDHNHSLWSNWKIRDDYSLEWVASIEPGTIRLIDLPTAQSGVAIYQLVIGDGDPAHLDDGKPEHGKTFNFFTTTENYDFLLDGFAIDGLGVIKAAPDNPKVFSIDLMPGTMDVLDAALLEWDTSSHYIEGLAPPNAPVAGEYDGGKLNSIPGQTNQVENTIITSNTNLAFGWTGTNTLSPGDTKGWIGNYTNKVGAFNLAWVNVHNTADGANHGNDIWLKADATIDGEWTTAVKNIPIGDYTVTMSEYGSKDNNHDTPFGHESSALTLHIVNPVNFGGSGPSFGLFAHAYDDAYVVLQGQTLSALADLDQGVLANDKGVNGASTVTVTANALHGALQLAANGGVAYTPEAAFAGTDSFSYVAEGGKSTDDARVLIYVVPVLDGASQTLNIAALSDELQIASTYISVLGRGADAAGFAFWIGQLDAGVPTSGSTDDLASIANSMSSSAEAKALYPFLANPQGASDAAIGVFLDSVYENMFNRTADFLGLSYWTGQIKAAIAEGQGIGSILVNIAGGAQETATIHDITTLMSKVAVSLDYIQQQENFAMAWAGETDLAAATQLLDVVASDAQSVLVGIRNAEILVSEHA